MAWLPWVVAPALPLLRTVCLCPGATHISGRGTPFPSFRNEKGQNTSKLQNELINLADSGPQIQLQAPSQGYIWAYRPATTLSVLRISIQFCHYTLWVADQLQFCYCCYLFPCSFTIHDMGSTPSVISNALGHVMHWSLSLFSKPDLSPPSRHSLLT